MSYCDYLKNDSESHKGNNKIDNLILYLGQNKPQQPIHECDKFSMNRAQVAHEKCVDQMQDWKI